MPEDEIIERAREDEREGKSPSTQAGEFVREEMEHIREGEHGARSPQQAIAIGLSKARRAGVKLPPPKRGKASARTRKQAKRESGQGPQRQTQETFSQALARHQARVETRGTLRRFEKSAFPAGPLRNAPTQRRQPLPNSEKSCANAQEKRIMFLDLAKTITTKR